MATPPHSDAQIGGEQSRTTLKRSDTPTPAPPAAPAPLTRYFAPELADALEALGEKRFHADQILAWLHRRNAPDFESMTDLSKELRAKLPEQFVLTETTIARRHNSGDGTFKFLIGLRDGNRIETVMIPEEERRTVCVSTQVGCPVACVFCASGMDGLVRNLTAAEIVEQVLHVRRTLPLEERISNLVIMGIGEPLLNVTNLVRALKIFKASWGMGIGYNRMTLSTVGYIPQLQSMVQEGVVPNLALSLHAPNDEVRAKVVPTMKKVAVADIVKAGKEYREKTNKQVTFEYVLLKGINDLPKHAMQLGKRVAGTGCKVNVIPWNPVPELACETPDEAAVDRFVKALGATGAWVTVRRKKGDDIAAACGQLRHATVKN